MPAFMSTRPSRIEGGIVASPGKRPGTRPATCRISAAFHPLRLCCHPWEPTKRSERAERDQLEAHKMGLAERQLFEHLMGGAGISDVQDEHYPLAVLLRVPLIDLAIQIEVCGIPNLLRQHCKDFLRFDTGIDGSDSENFCGRRRLHGGLSVSSCYAGEAKHHGETGGECVLHLFSPFLIPLGPYGCGSQPPSRASPADAWRPRAGSPPPCPCRSVKWRG